MKRLLIIALFFQSFISYAQESNYANYEVGANSTMMGGAVTAGVKDNSAVYHNPGALAFVETSNVTLETGNLYGGHLVIKNGGGDGLDIKSTFFDLLPGAISGTIKSKKIPDWTFTYSLITTNSSFIEFDVRNSMVIDVLPNNPGDELYQGQYSYRNKMRENGLSFGTAKKIGSNIGIGASSFIVYNSQDYRLNQEATASAIINNGIDNTLAFSRITRELKFRSVGVIFQVGLVYKLERTKWAINITSPKLNMDMFAKGDVTENVNLFIPFVGAKMESFNRHGEGLKTIQKSPFKIAIGHEQRFKNSIWNFKATYYSEVAKYERISAPADQIVDGVDLSLLPLVVYDEAHSVMNFAIGTFINIREGLSFLGGARTDLNFTRKLDDPQKSEYYARMSYWNLYHFTGGVIWHTDKLNLTLGADYAIGLEKGHLQQVNLTDPTVQGLLFGERTATTNTNHNQVYIVFGLSYKFE